MRAVFAIFNNAPATLHTLNINFAFNKKNIKNKIFMKKSIIAFLTLALAAIGANAQDIFDNPANRSFFGIRLSYELACPGDVKIPDTPLKSEIFGNGSGFSVEAIYNIPLWKNLYFQPGAGIYYNTYSINKNWAADLLEDRLEMSDPNIKSASARQWGIRIPLHVGYNFDFTPDIRVAFFTGPEVNISFKGNTHYGIGKTNITEPLFGKDGYLNRADIKWRFGVGATFSDHYYIAVSGAVGMCDMFRDPKQTDETTGITEKVNLNMHSNLFDITLGYNF